jgi:hypothetical protein
VPVVSGNIRTALFSHTLGVAAPSYSNSCFRRTVLMNLKRHPQVRLVFVTKHITKQNLLQNEFIFNEFIAGHASREDKQSLWDPEIIRIISCETIAT